MRRACNYMELQLEHSLWIEEGGKLKKNKEI